MNKLLLAAAQPLEIESVNSLQGIQKPPMLVDNLLPKGSITLLAGPTYSGKTFFAMELARAVALGTKFMGHFNIAERGNVLFIEQDSPKYDTGRALWAMLHDYETDEERGARGFSDLDSLYVSWHPGLNLKNPLDLARIAVTANKLNTFRGIYFSQPQYEIDSQGEPYLADDGEHDEGYQGAALIILDTFRSLHTAEENSSTEMEAIMQGIKQLRQATGAAIVRIHHGPKPTLGQPDFIGVRGSTAIEGAVDTILKINSNRKTRQSSCVVVKARAIQPPDFHYQIIAEEQAGIVSKRVEFRGEITTGENDSSPEIAITALLAYIRSNSLGVTNEEAATWIALNGKSKATLGRWLSQLIKEGNIRSERDADGARYFAKEEK